MRPSLSLGQRREEAWTFLRAFRKPQASVCPGGPELSDGMTSFSRGQPVSRHGMETVVKNPEGPYLDQHPENGIGRHTS